MTNRVRLHFKQAGDSWETCLLFISQLQRWINSSVRVSSYGVALWLFPYMMMNILRTKDRVTSCQHWKNNNRIERKHKNEETGSHFTTGICIQREHIAEYVLHGYIYVETYWRAARSLNVNIKVFKRNDGLITTSKLNKQTLKITSQKLEKLSQNFTACLLGQGLFL